MPELLRGTRVLLACGLLVASAPALAAEPDRPVVAGFDRFFAPEGADLALGGRLLLGELNCTSCHRGDDAPLAPVAKKQAPILDRVGARVRVEHLRAFLADPGQAKAGTTMPNVLGKLPKGEADEAVDNLVHFLATTGSATETRVNRKQIGDGRRIYAQSGCAACHGPIEKTEDAPAYVVPMGDVPGKYTHASLSAFLLDPLACRPSGRMPGMGLKAEEAQAVASYLFRDVKVDLPPNLAYRYYEGDWDNLPDFDKLKPVNSGTADGFDLTVARRANQYAVRFEGVLDVDRAGTYAFFASSDDGTRVWVDGQVMVNNDGIHPATEKSGRRRLGQGKHAVVVGYFQGGGQAELDVEFQGPGLTRRPLAPELRLPGSEATPKPSAPVAEKFRADPSKAEKGRALFASIGCASCHQLREGDNAVASKVAAKALADLNPAGGCLSADPPKGVPDYRLTPRQRQALASALKPEGRKPTEKEAVHRTFLAFNCYTCHARDGQGGVEEGHDGVFATTQKEMGEEGRIPPNLSGVGGKLTEAWLKHILADGAKDRPYMLTRMPKFGEGNVGHLIAPLASLDVVPPVAEPAFDEPSKKVKATGRFIVGGQAFNCGSCHQFKEFQASGIQALDMTMMTKRLRRDWFHRYVVDPQQYRPGTRMPAAWPNGQSQLANIYGGDTVKQIESIWQYLSDGTNAAVPYGLGRDPIPLVAEKEPVLYRNFIQGAGARAIGVGYPEKANLAFDANDLRLALIWQGAFIDASRHWTGRGVGYEGPLGDNIVELAQGPGFALLADPAAPWPKKADRGNADRFLGYQLDSVGRPAFRYEVAGVKVEDRPEAVAAGRDSGTIRRTIDLTGDKPGLAFRAAVGKKIEPTADGWYAVDGEWKVRISGSGPARVRPAGDKVELIVPVALDAGKARIVEEFAW